MKWSKHSFIAWKYFPRMLWIISASVSVSIFSERDNLSKLHAPEVHYEYEAIVLNQITRLYDFPPMKSKKLHIIGT